MLALILIVYVLLHISVKAYIEFDKKRFKLKVKYLCFTVYKIDTSVPAGEGHLESGSDSADDSMPDFELSELEEVDSSHTASADSKPAEPVSVGEPEKKSEPQEVKEDKAVEPENQDKPKKSLKERWEEIKPYFPVAKKALRKLLKLIRFYDLELHLTVGGDDAYKAGMNFARANQAFYPSLALLCTAFSVKIKKTEIKCDYNGNTFDINGGVVVMARPSAVIALALYLGVNYLRISIIGKGKQKNNKKRKKDNSDE